jgi:hypothetical protein
LTDVQKLAYLKAVNPEASNQFEIMESELKKKSIEMWFEKINTAGEPKEETTWDKASQLIKENPQILQVGQEIIGKFLYLLNSLVTKPLTGQPVMDNTPVQYQPNPNPQQIQQPVPQTPVNEQEQQLSVLTEETVMQIEAQGIEKYITMKEFIERIIDAVEDEETELTLDHPLLKELEQQHGIMYPVVKGIIKAMPFDDILTQIPNFVSRDDYEEGEYVLDKPENVERLRALHQLLQAG